MLWLILVCAPRCQALLTMDYKLETPENVDFSYEVAGLGSRFIAAFVDSLIQLTLFLLVGVAALAVAGLMIGLLAALSMPGESALVAWMVGGGLVLLFLVLWGYYVFFEVVWNGQSPGKRLTRIRVISEDGYPVTFLSSLVRNLVRVVDFLPSYYVVGVVVMLLNRRAKRLGDFAAGTVVVKERGAMTIEHLRRSAEPRRHGTLDCARRLDSEDRDLVRDFLARRSSLPSVRREALARELATLLAERLECDRSQLEDEEFLEALADATSAGRRGPLPPRSRSG